MSNKDKELERLMRLREQQIRTRDPHAKGRELHGRLAERGRRHRKPVTLQGTLQEMLTDIPGKWQGAIIGGTLGLVISIVLAVAVGAYWVALVGLAATIVLAIVGYFLGTSFDWRDELRDEMKDR